MFKSYAKFLIKEKLQYFTKYYLDEVIAMDIPLMKLYTEMPYDQLMELSLVGTEKFLNDLMLDKAMDEMIQNNKKWENDELDNNISNTSITVKDLVLIMAAQKKAFIHCLNFFTDDVKKVTAVLTEMEEFYQMANLMSFETVVKIQLESQKEKIETQERYLALLNSSFEIILDLDQNGKILSANNACEELLNFPKEEIIGRNIQELITPDERQSFQRIIDHIIKNPESKPHFETNLLTGKGDNLPVDTLALIGKGRSEIYLQVIMRDISDYVQQQEELKSKAEIISEREATIRMIVQHAPAGLIVLDDHLKVTEWNPMAEFILGYKLEETHDQALSKVLKDDSLTNEIQRLAEDFVVKGSNRSEEKKINLNHKNGQQITASFIVSRFTFGHSSYYILFLNDISELEKRKSDLKQRSSELEQSNRKLSDVAKIAAHDLKEPARKIMLQVDLIRNWSKEKIDAANLENLIKINEYAEHMSSLIDGILLYSESIQRKPLVEKLDTKNLPEELLKEFQTDISRKNATIQFHKIETITADREQIIQLFRNLIHNSLFYCNPEIAPQIEIIQESQADKTIFKIRDNGLGFDNQYSEKIFEIFHHLSTYDKGHGIGLGLTVCREIVNAHEGQIRASSQPGKGTEITIELPFITSETKIRETISGYNHY